jgi:hypothetical protein
MIGYADHEQSTRASLIRGRRSRERIAIHSLPKLIDTIGSVMRVFALMPRSFNRSKL